jgi:mono/diheme cytochrome c family protein
MQACRGSDLAARSRGPGVGAEIPKMSDTLRGVRAACVMVAALSSTAVALAQTQDIDTAIAPAVQQVNEKYSEYNLDIKKLFAQKCSWCHQGYGMRQADGPKLAGTDKTKEQLMKQIANGKSPMPGFKSQLKEHELQALAEYIKALPKN